MPLYKRSLLLSATLPLLLGLNGVIFLEFEDIDEGEYKDESDFFEYCYISSISSLIGWIFTVLIDFVTYKCENDDAKKKNGDLVYIVLIGLMFILATLTVGYMII